MLRLEVKRGVAWVTLNRPAVHNVLNRELVELFGQTVKELKSRSDARVVVTRGEGKSFCAGSDLKELATLSPAAAAKHEFAVGETLSGLDRLPQPTIAGLHGHVLGGGLGLALYHDFRVASETASIGMPEVELGWIPPWAVGRLVETVGHANARWLLMTCARMTGRDALKMNVVHEVAPAEQLQARLEEIAARLAAMPVAGLARTKALVNKMSPLRQVKWDAAAAEGFRFCFAKPEARQRVNEFLARKNRPQAPTRS